MTITEDRRSLTASCVLFDFVLKLLMCRSDDSTAGIALEHTVDVLRVLNFDQGVDMRSAKFVVSILTIMLVLSLLDQPSCRRLIADLRNNERQWCILRFDHIWLQTYDIVIDLVSTIGSLLIDLVMARLVL